MTERNEQLMKFKVTNDKLMMEISIKDLVFLFENDPNNSGFDGDGIAKVKQCKQKEFVEYLVNHLLDDCTESEGDYTNWGLPFEKAFMSIFEGYEDNFINYPRENEEE